MSWKEEVVVASRRFGPPIRFAARLIVGALTPGGSAVVELVGQALDAPIESKDSWLPVTAADLQRVGDMLDVLNGDLAGLTESVAALEGLPEAATKILDVALRTDDRCRSAVRKIHSLTQAFDALRKQHEELVTVQRNSQSSAAAPRADC